MLAQAQRDAGDLDGAEATARALQTAHPDDVRAIYLLGQMLDARGRHQEIVDLLKPEIARQKAAKAKSGQIAMLLGSQGLALQQLRRYDEAVAAFTEAIDLAPEEPVRYVLLIQGYSAGARHKEALDAAEKARAKFPQRHDRALPARRRPRPAPAASRVREGVPRRDRARIRSTPARSTTWATCWPSAARRSTRR